MIDLMLFDHSPFNENSHHTGALLSTAEVAQTAEKLSYKKFRVPEHHGVKYKAGSNPEILTMQIAANTTIQIGSGSAMLQHYSVY